MMVNGLLAAIIVSAVWIVLQNLLMHFRPAENRFGAMLTGYLLSLPAVYLVYQWLLSRPTPSTDEAYGLGLFHAYLFHLLLYFCYGECFYHVERSVTLRFFVEILQRGDRGAKIEAIQQDYSIDEMVRQRLEVMRDHQFLAGGHDGWRLRLKGAVLARLQMLGSRFFQFKGQHERM